MTSPLLPCCPFCGCEAAYHNDLITKSSDPLYARAHWNGRALSDKQREVATRILERLR